MSRGLWALGLLVFSITLLVSLPAAWVLGIPGWASSWQPWRVSGTLWQGRAERLGVLGSVNWQVRPLQREARLSAGFQQQAWSLTVSGWPWNWQVALHPGGTVAAVSADYLLDGHWQGRLLVQGQGLHCVTADGELTGQRIALLAPWTLALGQARISVGCQPALHLLADIQRTGEHRLHARAEPLSGRLYLNGEVRPDAALAPLLVQAGWLKPQTGHLETVIGRR